MLWRQRHCKVFVWHQSEVGAHLLRRPQFIISVCKNKSHSQYKTYHECNEHIFVSHDKRELKDHLTGFTFADGWLVTDKSNWKWYQISRDFVRAPRRYGRTSWEPYGPMHCNICYIDDILPLVPVCFMDAEINKDWFHCCSKDTLCQEYWIE